MIICHHPSQASMPLQPHIALGHPLHIVVVHLMVVLDELVEELDVLGVILNKDDKEGQ
jgi:hypothetical protein